MGTARHLIDATVDAVEVAAYTVPTDAPEAGAARRIARATYAPRTAPRNATAGQPPTAGTSERSR